MKLTTSSPKYASAESLQFQMWKKQQSRKKRIKNNAPPSRYFRRNEGSTDYATIPEVTLAGDFVIEFDFSTSSTGVLTIMSSSSFSSDGAFGIDVHNGSVRFFIVGSSSSATVAATLAIYNDGKVHKCLASFNSFSGEMELIVDGNSHTATITDLTETVKINLIYRRSSSAPQRYFEGILANIKIYDAGTLVRHYPLNDNGNTLIDLAGGQNGTVINGNASDWGLFTQQANGDWLGQELVVNGGFDDDSGWTLGSGWTINDGAAHRDGNEVNSGIHQDGVFEINKTYRIKTSLYNFSSSTGVFIIYAGQGSQNLVSTRENTEIDIIRTTTTTANRLLLNGADGLIADVDNVSVKEVLKNA